MAATAKPTVTTSRTVFGVRPIPRDYPGVRIALDNACPEGPSERASRADTESVIRVAGLVRRAFSFVRWWFGLTYVLTGAGAVIAGPVMLANGNGGGAFMLIGAPFIAMFGWLVHPWGLQRTARREAEGYDRTSALLPDRWITQR